MAFLNRLSLCVVLLLLVASPVLGDAMNDERVVELESRFTPTHPTLVLSYETAYRFLFIQLKRIANLTIEATEGVWRSEPDGKQVPAMLIKTRIMPPGPEKEGERRSLSIRRTITTVLTMPDLQTLVYCKQADEYVNPLFRAPKITQFVEIYNMESGELSFYRRNYRTGEVSTNLVGDFDVSKQGREIPSMLEMMSKVYSGKQELLTKDSGFRIYINIDGLITPYAVTTKWSETPKNIVGGRMKAMRVDAVPAPEAKGRGRPADLLTASLLDLAKHVGKPDVIALAEKSPEWSMIPLVADYALAIGYVRAWVTSVEVSPIHD